MLDRVVFSERAIIALLAETQEHIETETGGVFLGYRRDNIWYVVETVDPGPNSIFQPAYFEYDDVYLNHLMNKVAKLYKKPLDIVGLWHRHPGSFDQFSSTDDGTNLKYAKRNKDGSISALVNIDPNFRLTIYHVTEPLNYRKVDYTVGDCYFPPEYLNYVSRDRYLNVINNSTKTGTILSKIKKNDKSNKNNQVQSKGFALFNMLADFLEQSTNVEVINDTPCEIKKNKESSLETILEELQLDLDFFENSGIKVTLSMLDEEEIKIQEDMTRASTIGNSLVMFIYKDNVVFNFDNKNYRYYRNMFKDACDFYTMQGGEL